MSDMRIEAGSATLMRQASMTAVEYLTKAIDEIDLHLGHGYARDHPELIGAFMQTAAMDMGAAVIARAIETLANEIENQLDGLVEAARSDHPLQAETFDAIDTALNRIAEALEDKES